MSTQTPTLLDALTGIPRLSPPAWRRIGWLRRYLITARAAVLPLTLHACLLGGLLALPWTPGEGWRLFLVTTGLVLAHATSNLLNDEVDWLTGLDADDYFRVRYGAHPLAQGLMNPATHGLLLLATAGATLAVGLMVCRLAGAPAYWLATAGALLLLLYTWPLKRLGLGEVAVFLVWGPLMVGGSYWVVSGDWGPDIAALSLLAGIGPLVVVMAKHTDKRRDDAARGVRTLPVVLGAAWAPRVVGLLAIVQVACGLGWAWWSAQWGFAALVLALPALWRLLWTCLRPRPGKRPERFPASVWPLWYSAAGFRFARASGLALVAAALIEGVW
jgi:1,4-dihydroxy-2-naphthoate octaprenyltransferase